MLGRPKSNNNKQDTQPMRTAPTGTEMAGWACPDRTTIERYAVTPGINMKSDKASTSTIPQQLPYFIS